MPSRVVFIGKDGRAHPLDEIMEFDSIAGGLTTITTTHSEIHEGNSFTTEVVDETLANAETLIIAFKTGSGVRRAHLFVFFATLVGGSLEIWEGATWTTNTGTATAIINRKRDGGTLFSELEEDKTKTPVFIPTNNVLENPTGLNTTGATSLDKQYAWGEKGKIGAGYLRDENEFILEPATKYAIVFTAIGADNRAQISLNWYEHGDNE